MSGVDINKMKIADLKAELKAKGLPVSGNKQDLVERLQTAMLDDNDDLLDQDDSMTEEAILQAEEELKVPSKPPKINRDTHITPSTLDTVSTGANVVKHVITESPAKGKENAPVPVVSPTKAGDADQVEDKIKARAERFGGFQSDEAKKAARAAKYGTAVSTAGSNKLDKSVPSADLDTLKKRADRFGTSSSTVMKKAELSDAIKRRQERFGVITKDEPKPKKVTLNAGTNSIVMDEKMAARAARFGTQ